MILYYLYHMIYKKNLHKIFLIYKNQIYYTNKYFNKSIFRCHNV